MRVAVITISDSVVKGAREDTSGAVVTGWALALQLTRERVARLLRG